MQNATAAGPAGITPPGAAGEHAGFAPDLAHDAVDHRRLVRALVVACIAAGSWLALHDAAASFDVLNAPVEAATLVR